MNKEEKPTLEKWVAILPYVLMVIMNIKMKHIEREITIKRRIILIDETALDRMIFTH